MRKHRIRIETRIETMTMITMTITRKVAVALFLGLAATGATSLLGAREARAIEVGFEQDSSLPVVYLNLAVKAGTVTDPDGQAGLTNFMGEMLLRGTKSRSKEQIDLALDQMGARLEVETRAEALIMRGAVLASQLDRFLDLVTEIVTQPSFPEPEIRKLKSEIISGILEELGHDQSLAGRKFTEFLFAGHPYGKPILGKVKDVQKLARAAILQHYDRLFRARYLLVVGAGDASSERVERWAKAIAADRQDVGNGGKGNGETAFVKVPRPENSPSRRMQIVDKPERTQTQIHIGQIGIRMTDPDYFPLYLGNQAFGGGSFSARMMVEIRVKRGWSYGASSHFRQGLQPRSWAAYLFPAAKDTPEALGYTLKMIDGLRAAGITQEEYDFNKRSLINSAGFMYDTPKKRVENKLLERTLDLPDGFMKSYAPNLEKVKLSEVNEALKRFLKPEQLAISVLGTAKDLKEPLAKAAAIPADKVQVVPYTE